MIRWAGDPTTMNHQGPHASTLDQPRLVYATGIRRDSVGAALGLMAAR